MADPCQITGVLRDNSGDPLPDTRIVFRRDGVVGQGGAVVVGRAEEATTDAQGQLTVELWPGIYTMMVGLEGLARPPATRVAVPELASAELAELIDGPDVAITPQMVLDAQAARAGAEAALAAMLARDAVELRRSPNGVNIEWRQAGTTTWSVLVPVADLMPPVLVVSSLPATPDPNTLYMIPA